MDPGAPEVRRDQDHPAAGLGERHGEVGRGRRLAVPAHGAGDHEHLQVLPGREVLDVRAQRPVGLAHRILGIGAHDQLGLVRLPPPALLGHRRQDGGSEAPLQLLAGPDPIVHGLPDEGQADPEDQAGHRGQG